MRVLYASHFGGLGGAERSLLELMVAVRKLGVEPMLMCPAGPLGLSAAAADIPIIAWCASTITRSLGSSGWQYSFPRLLRGWRELDRALKEFRPHIIHANSTQAMLWNGPVAAFHGCPVVWHWRDFYDTRRFARSLVRGADAVVAISKAVLTFAMDLLGPSARQLVLVRNGIADLPNCDTNNSAALRCAMGIPPDAPLIVMAGHSVPRKGHAVLLQALAQLTTMRPDMRAWLLCAEHTPEAAAHTRRLRRQAADFGCGRAVQITEGVEQIAPVLRASNVVVVPSLREPFGRIAVEAMLAERPLVASAVDGLNEIVAQDETGLLVSPGDASQLAATLFRVLAEPALWALRGKAARRRALRLFSISRVADEVLSLYKQLRYGYAFKHAGIPAE